MGTACPGPMLGDPISGGKLIEEGVFHAAVLSRRDNTIQILAEAYSGAGPDHLDQIGKDIVMQEALKNPGLGSNKTLACMAIERCSCFFKVDNRILFLAVVDDHAFGTRRAAAFLDSIASKFKVGFQGTGTGRDTREFDAVLKEEMEYWSDQNNLIGARDDELARKIDGLKRTAIDSMALAVERQGQVDILEDQANSLVSSTAQFTQSARQMRWKMLCQNVKCWIGITVVVLVLILVLLMVLCQPNFSKCK